MTVISAPISTASSWPLVVIALLLAAGLAPAPIFAADTPQFNGSWVLDAEHSEDFDVAAKKMNEDLKRLRAKHSKNFVEEQRHGSGNQFYEQQHETEHHIRDDSRFVGWDVEDQLRSMLTAKTLKLYQARMCAILYDKQVKRLLSINPAGNVYSVSGNEIAHDAVGRSVSYFDHAALVIDTDVAGGDRLIERFALDDSGKQLKLMAKLRRRDLGRTLEFTRVYLRDE